MVSFQEDVARFRQYLRYSKQEMTGLVAAIFVTALLFSFHQEGETYNLLLGIRNFLLVAFIAALSFFFRTFCQKAYALTQGHSMQFKVWWGGLVLGLLVAFLSATLSGGRFVLPLLLIGGSSIAFMTRIRLGEFRYGISYWVNGTIAYWAVIGSLIMAILFSIGSYIFPGAYFFRTGVVLNLIAAACALLPVPQMEGLPIFFAHRGLFVVGIFLVILAAILLLTNTLFGLLLTIILGIVYGAVTLLIGSEI